MLCGECATGRKSHIYDVSPKVIARGFAASLTVAALAGWLMADLGNFGFFMLWLGFLYGLGVAEVMLRVTGRKRGTAVEIATGASAIGGIVLGWLIFASVSGFPEWSEYLMFQLSSPWTYVVIGCAVFAAVGRIRNL